MEVANQRAEPTRGEFDRSYANMALVLMALMVVMVLYVEAMLTPSLPAIQREFGVTSAQVSLVLALYLVSGIALAPILGKLGDIYGKKRVLNYVLVVYCGAVTLTGFSPTFEFMLGSRMIQGVGLGVMPLAMTLIREEFPRDLVPRAQSIISAMFGVGAAVSIPIGAYVSNQYGWQFTYHTAVPFVVLTAGLLIYKLRESRYSRPHSKVDFIGAGVLAGSLGMVVLGLSLGPSRGWTDPVILALVFVGAGVLFPLVFYERGVREPILNMRLLSERDVLVTDIVILVTGFGMFLAMQTMAFKFESPSPSGFGYNIFDTGLSIVPFMIAQLVFAPVAGFLVTRVGVKPLSMVGAGTTSLGFILASLTTTSTQLMITEFFAGSGIALLNASVINLLILTVDPRDLGLATSLNTVFRTLGSSMGAPVAGTVLATFTVSIQVGQTGSVPIFALFPAPHAYQYAFYVAAAFFLVLLVVIPFALEVLGKHAQCVDDSAVGPSDAIKRKDGVEGQGK